MSFVGQGSNNWCGHSAQGLVRNGRESLRVRLSLTWLTVLTGCAHSPRNNQNLLQRSEVVALINTLHRFSESLHIVERFREMWKHVEQQDSERLIYKAEKATGAYV